MGTECLHRHCHRKIGLAGACRADAQYDGVVLDGFHILFLSHSPCPDGLAGYGNCHRIRRQLLEILHGTLRHHVGHIADGLLPHIFSLGSQP